MTPIDPALQLNRRNPRTGVLEPVPASDRIRAILDHDHARDLVRQMDPQGLHALIHDAGLEDCHDLILMASAEQVQHLMDHDVWSRDRLEPERFATWLAILLQHEDEDLAEALDTLDPELIPLWLRQRIGVLFWEHDRELLDAIEAPVMSSPDGVYALVVPDEEADGPLIRLLLERLYALDVGVGRRALETVRWELSAQLEEQACQARLARLEDQGFVPFDEAREVYAWLDPGVWRGRIRDRALTSSTPPITLGAGALPLVDTHLQHLEADQRSADPSFLVRALGAIGAVFPEASVEAIADAILSQLRAVTNRVHIADGADTGDQSAARLALGAAQRRVSLALELVSGGDPAVGARTLGTTPLILLHRLGHSAVMQLSRQAHAMHARGNLQLIEQPFSLLPEEDRDLLAGLRRPRPCMSETYGKPFRTASELERAAQRVGRIAAVELLLFEHAGWRRDALVEAFVRDLEEATPVELIHLGAVVSTHLLSGRPDLPPAPLPAAEIRQRLASLAEGPGVVPGLQAMADAWIRETAPPGDPAAGLARSWLSDAFEAIGRSLGERPEEAPLHVLQAIFVIGVR